MKINSWDKSVGSCFNCIHNIVSRIHIHLCTNINGWHVYHKIIWFLALCDNSLCGRTIQFRTITSGGISTLEPKTKVNQGKKVIDINLKQHIYDMNSNPIL